MIVGEEWVNQDPLTISATQLQVFQLFEATLCPATKHRVDCKCDTIKRHYGPRPFKCTRFGCQFFRTGFESAADQNRHVLTHDRPYLCDRPNCEFGKIGFSSKSRLHAHLKYHENHKLISRAPEADIDGEDDMRLFLKDAVKDDNVDIVRAFNSEIRKFAEPLLREAVESSSLRMLELLLEASEGIQINQSKVLLWAVGAGNMAATQMLLDWGASAGKEYLWHKCISDAMSKRSPKMLELLLQYNTEDTSFESMIYDLYDSDIFIKDMNSVEEANVIMCLGLLRDWSSEKEHMGRVLTMNARKCCSIAIASFLLERGVDVNFHGKKHLTSLSTALYFASAKKGQRAANLMKFLLESGADPLLKPSRSTQLIANRPGPRNIQKWLGMTWEQLVEDSAKVHTASQKPAKERGALF